MDCIKYQIFIVSCIFKFLRPAQRFEDSKHIKITRKAACLGITDHIAYLSILKKAAKLLSSSFPVSPSRVLRAPGTSLYHIVPKHFRATWLMSEPSHLFPEACSSNGNVNIRQRQTRTNRPPSEPSDILNEISLLYITSIDAFS